MCIVVNGEEECGFGEVSTSFAVNYIEDKYAQEKIPKLAERYRAVRKTNVGNGGFGQLYGVV